LAISVVREMTQSLSCDHLARWPIGSGNGLPPPPGRDEGDPDRDGVSPNALVPEAVLVEESDPDGGEASAASR
jgi:hypothetical protein